MGPTAILETIRQRVRRRWLAREVIRCQRRLKANPTNIAALQALAEIRLQTGDISEAVDQLSRAASCLVDDGQFLEAVNAHQRILKLAPWRIDAHHHLAWLYEQLGLTSESVREHEIVFQHFARAGRGKQAVTSLRRIVELQPCNIAARIRLAEACAREGMIPEALDAFRKAIGDLRRHHRQDGVLDVLLRMESVAPGDMGVAFEVGQGLFGRGDMQGALSRFQRCLRANRENIDALQWLSRTLVALKRIADAVTVQRALAAVYDRRKDRLRECETLRGILHMLPDDAWSRARLAEIDGCSVTVPAPRQRSRETARSRADSMVNRADFPTFTDQGIAFLAASGAGALS